MRRKMPPAGGRVNASLEDGLLDARRPPTGRATRQPSGQDARTASAGAAASTATTLRMSAVESKGF